MEENHKREKVREYAIEGFRNGLNCAESVFDSLQRSGMLEVSEGAIAMCVGFGGGIGLSGYTCGALSAAVMAVGAKHGRKDPWAVPAEERGPQIAQKYYRRYNRLVDDFRKIHGVPLCREITSGMEWSSKERRLKCMNLIGDTAVLAYDYLKIPQEEAFILEYKDNMSGLK